MRAYSDLFAMEHEVIILKDSLLGIPMTLFPKIFLVSWAARRWSSVWIVPNAILCVFRFPCCYRQRLADLIFEYKRDIKFS